MEKTSEFEHPVIDLIQKRRSIRTYAECEVEEEKIRMLFEAARWAPSSGNEQPWRYLYACRDNILWQKILGTLHPANQVWAKNAPLLILSLVRKNSFRDGKPNDSARYDLGAANAFLSLQATHLGLSAHQIGGFDRQMARDDLQLNDECEPMVIISVGYPGSAETLTRSLQLRELAPRERYRQGEFVTSGSGHPVSK